MTIFDYLLHLPTDSYIMPFEMDCVIFDLQEVNSVTIYDIAQEAGVSASTVSRVLNGKKGVSADTRLKIESLLQKYNFEPNASAQGLVSQSSKLVGIIMSDIRTPHHAEGAYYIEQQLSENGYSCIIVNSGFSDQSRENGIRLLAARRPDAVVLIGSTFQNENIKRSIHKYLRNLPVIIENGFIDLPNVYSVLADEQNGIAECLRLLYRKGRKSPCYATMTDTPSNRLKTSGFEQAWLEHNHNRQRGDVPVYRFDRRQGEEEWTTCYHATRTLIQSHPEIDSIIFCTDLFANAGVRALSDLGIDISGQVAVIGVDNSIYATLCRPQLTTLDNKMPELSVACSNNLIQLLKHEKVSRRMMILSDIIERETT